MAMAVSCGEENTTPTPAPTPGGNTGGNGDGGNGGQQTEALKADFTFVADGMTVTFTNASTGATAYMWDFGDEETSTEQNPTHEYAAAGEYTVTLTVSDAAGATAKKEATFSVAGKAKAYFEATADKTPAGKRGKIFAFDATASENPATIAWDFGDGTTIAAGTEFTVNHEFPEFGETYTVKATVVGVGGDTSEYTAEVEVVAYTVLSKGANMELDDAQYWEFINDSGVMAEDWSGLIEGLKAWVPTFGYTATLDGFTGGCLNLSGADHNMANNYNTTFYQKIEAAEGEILKLNGNIAWDANTVDNGNVDVLVGTALDALEHVAFIYNYWSCQGTGDEKTSTPLPATSVSFDDVETLGEIGWECNLWEVEDEAELEPYAGGIYFKAPATGEYYVAIKVTNNWGLPWGPTSNFYFDNVSVEVVY